MTTRINNLGSGTEVYQTKNSDFSKKENFKDVLNEHVFDIKTRNKEIEIALEKSSLETEENSLRFVDLAALKNSNRLPMIEESISDIKNELDAPTRS